MARKKHQHHEEHENHERWLISYADYMTLLFALFVVLYAIASTEKGQADQIINSVIETFYQEGLISPPSNSVIFEGGTGVTRSNTNADLTVIKATSATSSQAPANPIDLRSTIQSAPNPISDWYQHVKIALKAELESNEIELEQLGQQLVIRINSPVAFAKDSHFLQPKFTPLVTKISAAIADLPGIIQIVGHTDISQPDEQLYRNNMELSALRAVSIANVLIRNPLIDSDRVLVIGAGSSKLSNQSKTNNLHVAEIFIAQGSPSNETLSLE